jgi:iron complex outermembrane receptor protein
MSVAAAFGVLPVTLFAQPTQSASPAKDEAVMLQPFEVTGVSTKRYLASNSISGTALNMLLKDVPMTINVITSEFLEDAVLGDLARTLDYNSSISQTTRGENNNRVGLFATRGFRARNLLLDGVLASDFLPTYLIDRIEVVKGPNTLYGQSDPGGLVNVISKRPLAQNAASMTFKYGSWNTREVAADVNAAKVAKGLNFRFWVRTKKRMAGGGSTAPSRSSPRCWRIGR